MRKKLLVLFLSIILATTTLAIGVFADNIKGGDSIATATNISFDTKYVSALDTTSDGDYYKFTAPETAYYNIHFTNINNHEKRIILSEEYGEQIERMTKYSEQSGSLNFILSKGQAYIIKVTTYTNSNENMGMYSFTVSYKVDDEPNVMENAKAIGLNEKYVGEIDGRNDIDYFCFYGNENTEYNFTLSEVSTNDEIQSKKITLYDAQNSRLDYEWNNKQNQLVTITGKGHSLYYICIQIFDTGVTPHNTTQQHKYNLVVTSSDYVDTDDTYDKPADYYPEPSVIPNTDDHSETYLVSSYTKCTQYDAYYHTQKQYYDEYCSKCNKWIAECVTYENELHYFLNGKCTDCGYIDEYYEPTGSFSPTPQQEIKIMVNGQYIYCDVPPQIINDRTMVPVRAIFEAIGATVEWRPEKQEVFAEKWNESTQGWVFASFTIGSNIMMNSFGEMYTYLESPAIIIDGRTLVPIRAAAEAFNYNVEWDAQTRTVIIYE